MLFYEDLLVGLFVFRATVRVVFFVFGAFMVFFVTFLVAVVFMVFVVVVSTLFVVVSGVGSSTLAIVSADTVVVVAIVSTLIG